MATNKPNPVQEGMGNIEQVRDILFGAQTREYNNRFEKLEKELVLLRQDLNERSKQIKDSFTVELRSAVESLEKKLKNLTRAKDDDIASLRQHLDRVEKKFTTDLSTLEEALEEQASTLHKDLSQVQEDLQEDLRSLRTQLIQELDKRLSALEGTKVAKDDMAELLFELGMRLKGTDLVPHLAVGEAAGSNHQPTLNLNSLGNGNSEQTPP